MSSAPRPSRTLAVGTALAAGVALAGTLVLAAPSDSATTTTTPARTTSSSSTSPVGTTGPATTSRSVLTTTCTGTTLARSSAVTTSPGAVVHSYDFEDGTVQGWTGSGGVTVSNSQDAAQNGSGGLLARGLAMTSADDNGALVSMSGFGTGVGYRYSASVRLAPGQSPVLMRLQPTNGSSYSVADWVTSDAWTTLTGVFIPTTYIIDYPDCSGGIFGTTMAGSVTLRLSVDQHCGSIPINPVADTAYLDNVSVTVSSTQTSTVLASQTTACPGSTTTTTTSPGRTCAVTATGCLPPTTTTTTPGRTCDTIPITGATAGCLPPTTTTTTTTKARSCTARLVVNSSWAGGFQGTVTVTAGALPLSGWQVAWTFANGQKITQAWGATVTTSGSAVTATNLPWNGNLVPSASTTFGFLGTWQGTNTVPTPTCTAL